MEKYVNHLIAYRFFQAFQLEAIVHLVIRKLIIEEDNLSIINEFKCTCTTLWEITSNIEDPMIYNKNVDFIKIYHCFREVNQAVDFIAKNDIHYVTSKLVIVC